MLFPAACSLPSGNGGYPPHQPGLRLIDLARAGTPAAGVFSSYRPNGPCQWNQDWPWKLDLSGVAWDKNRTVTAITPRHVVMANHFQRPQGAKVVFHDRRGRPHRRQIERVLPLRNLGVSCDVAVGLLDRPLPDAVRSYPVPELSREAAEDWIGATVLVTEQGRRLYFHEVLGFGPKVVRFRTNRRVSERHHKRLVVGDSGHPAFVLSKGELVLVETHTTGGSGAGPFYGDPAVRDGLREAIRQLDPAFSLRAVGADPALLQDAREGRAARATPASPPTIASPTASLLLP